MKIQLQLMIAIIPVLIAIFGITSLTTSIISTSALEDQARENANLLSHSYSEQLDSALRRYFTISQDLGSAVITAINIETTLQALRKRYPQFKNIFYTPADGKVLEMAPYKQQYLGFDLKNIQAWQQAFDTRLPAVSAPGVYFGEQAVCFFAPAILSYVANQTPKIVGMIAMVLPLYDLFKDIKNVTIGNSGSIFVIDDKGVFLYHEEEKRILTDNLATFSNISSLKQVALAMINQKTGFSTYSDKKGRQYISFSPISTARWSLGVNGTYNEITSGINKIILINLFVVLIGIALAIAILYFMVHSVVHPIAKLTTMAQKIEKGNYKHVIPFDDKDKKRKNEISNLTLAFNKMTLELESTFINLKNEIAERKKTELALGKAQNYINNIVDSMPSILIGVDADGQVTHWNKAAENTTGIISNNAYGKNITDVFPQMESGMNQIAESIKTRTAVFEQKKPHQSEKGVNFEDITIYPLVSNGVEGAVIRIDDVTQKVRLEEMMVQNEKMLSVGGLAAGMAHEINNPLAGIMQTAEVMSNRLSNIDMPANQKAAREADISMSGLKSFMEKRGILRMAATIHESGQRMAEIVNNMLSFARKSDASVSTHAPAELLDKILELASTDFNLKKQYDFKTIEIIKEYEPNLPMILCDGAKIQQVLLNILKNGAQAMQNENRGSDKKPKFLLHLSHESSTDMLRMKIEDNGPGMDEKTRKRIFEPFFTTKPVGVGTGLGLSVSYFIITENHGGTMDVISEPEKGAVFIIRLPIKGKHLPIKKNIRREN